MQSLTPSGALSDPFRNFIAVSRYARWIDGESRRETYQESVGRYISFIKSHVKRETGYQISAEDAARLTQAIEAQEVGPSMRALMTAGPALERNNIAGYNCAYLPIDHPRAFDELLYILMNGTGVGFSVEKKYVKQLLTVPESFEPSPTVIKVSDSKEGWAKGLRELVALLYAGQIPTWDLSEVRAAGARLKIFGGRASGPAPLDDLFRFAVALFTNAAGRKLTTLEAHDFVCKIASVVVVGGVRRSALISLSDLEDGRMAVAKSGQWWEHSDHRRLANNSVAYSCKPDMESFMREWLNLYESKSGERGVFNREASQRQAAKYGRRDAAVDYGTNPCSEIILRPYQFCNLTTVAVRPEDSLDDLRRKVTLAAVLGTFQSTLSNFKYLRKVWKKNTEEERLLGVSMTGQLAHPVLSGQKGLDTLATWLDELRQVAVDTNKVWAERLGIPQSTAVTCVKPEGTSSQLFGTASGLHPWHNDYYIRTVRSDKKDPLAQFLIDVGIPYEEDVHSATDWVFSFPLRAPEGSLTRKDLTAVEHLEIWLTYQRHWCEHKPSVTISVRDHEWMQVGAWVWEHFDEISGISFLPYTEHIYKQAPYQDITAEEYADLAARMPTSIRWEDLTFYETEDGTTGSQELSCAAGGCDVVDIGNAAG